MNGLFFDTWIVRTVCLPTRSLDAEAGVGRHVVVRSNQARGETWKDIPISSPVRSATTCVGIVSSLQRQPRFAVTFLSHTHKPRALGNITHLQIHVTVRRTWFTTPPFLTPAIGMHDGMSRSRYIPPCFLPSCQKILLQTPPHPLPRCETKKLRTTFENDFKHPKIVLGPAKRLGRLRIVAG